MSESNLVVIRPIKPEEMRFVHGTWHDSYFPFLKDRFKVEYDVYQAGQQRIMDNILERPDTRVMVAHFQLVPDELLGYSVYEKDVLHHIYVKPPYRRKHVAQKLVPGAGVLKWYSHGCANAGLKFTQHLNLKFHPYKAWG